MLIDLSKVIDSVNDHTKSIAILIKIKLFCTKIERKFFLKY